MKIRASLRWQLQLYYGAILFVTLAILTSLAIHWMRESERHKYDSRLRDMQRFVVPVVSGYRYADPSLFRKVPSARPIRARRRGFPDSSQGATGLRGPYTAWRDHVLEEIIIEGWCFGAWSHEGTLAAASRNCPDFLKPTVFPDENQSALIRDYQGYRQLILGTPEEWVVIAYPLALLNANASQQAWMIIVFSGALLLASASLGWVLIGRALRPLHDIEDAASDIAKGRLSRRIAPSSQPGNEIGILAHNLNHTFSRLETMFERQLRFTSDASHELRTPITVILNHCQHALAKPRTPEEYQAALRACRRAGDRMKNLTTGLLELSKLETGEIELAFADCQLDEIAEEALELVEPLAHSKGIVLKDDVRPVTIHGNGDRIWQVLVNLLTNAIEHTPTGKSVTLRTRREGERVNISIIDEGEGIPQESIPHLFERFYRVDGSRARTRQHGGFGLGLAISDTIVKAHQGTIHVESQPGVRTVFTIELPA